MSDANDKNRPASDSDLSPERLELERRRKTMRRILAGGGLIAGSQALPEKWARPVIDSVILPAHAVASPVVTTTAPATTTPAPTTTITITTTPPPTTTTTTTTTTPPPTTTTTTTPAPTTTPP